METKQFATKDFFNQESVRQKFQEMLGKRAAQFITSVMQVVSNNDYLKNATPQSIYGAAITAAILDLPIQNNLGFAYIVPYKDNKTGIVQAQFQIGYKGLKQLSLRSCQFLTINETDVRDGEIVSYNRLSGEIEFSWIEDFTKREKAKIVGYVSYFKLANGFESTLFKTVEQLEAHAKKFSQPYKKGFGVWKDDFDSMAMKTVVKLNLSKNAPLSVEMQRAITFDQSVTNDGENVEYIDNVDVFEPTESQKAKADKISDQMNLKLNESKDDGK